MNHDNILFIWKRYCKNTLNCFLWRIFNFFFLEGDDLLLLFFFMTDRIAADSTWSSN